MKRITAKSALALGILGTVVCTPVFADGKFSITANAEAESGSSNATDGTSDSGRSTGLGLQVRYDWPLASDVSFGVGLGFSGGNHQSGTYMSGATVTTNNRYSLDLEPAYSLSRDTLVFGKVSALAANVSSDDDSDRVTTQGVGYGFGLRQVLGGNLFWQAAFDVNRYNDVTFSTGTTTGVLEHVFSLGLGFRF